MKKLILIFFVLRNFTLLAQPEWAPIEAKWYYNQPSSESGNYVLIESIKDSLIQEKSVRVIDVKLNGLDLISREYLRQSMDSIFYFNTNSNTFNLLYNFSAKAGDTVIVHKAKFKPTKGFFSYYDSIPNFKYKIVSVDSIQINNIWHKRQKVIPVISEWNFFNGMSDEMDIIDRIGSLTYFFGRLQYTYPEQQPSILRCYIDSDINYKSAQWEMDCDFFTSNNFHHTDDNIQLYPNPANNFLNISAFEPVKIVEIYDIRGSKLISFKPNRKDLSLELYTLEKGVFIVLLKTTQKVYVRKIVKQ